ncbi:MAG: SDR family oxidoreductase [Alphaproteobacteria bacterium]|nr:MAG: SDR family oxidoreductase [Alphaproteobacteria bacterium]
MTGASAGLGAEFARQCAARGESVALAARRRDRLDAVAAEIGGDVHVFEADLAAPDGPAKLLADVAAAGLTVSTLINNAGFGLGGSVASIPLDRQLEMIDLNVRALTELCRGVLPGMLERGSGAILNVASTAAFQAGPHMAVYYAGKAYVLSFSEALHQEMKGTKIRVSCLCPGPTETEFFETAGLSGSALAKMAVPAAGVVRAGLKGLDSGKAIVIPGVMNKVGAQSTRFMPRSTLRAIVARLKA